MAGLLKLRVTFNVDSIVRTNSDDDTTQIFPDRGDPAPVGVGQQTTGRYVVAANLLGVIGHYVFARTNAFQDEKGGVVGIGQISYHLRHLGFAIVATSTYTIRTADPSTTPFSVDSFISPINYATFNGIPVQMKVELTPVRGGHSYKAVFSISLIPKLLKLLGGKVLLASDEEAASSVPDDEETASCQVVEEDTTTKPCPW